MFPNSIELIRLFVYVIVQYTLKSSQSIIKLSRVATYLVVECRLCTSHSRAAIAALLKHSFVNWWLYTSHSRAAIAALLKLRFVNKLMIMHLCTSHLTYPNATCCSISVFEEKNMITHVYWSYQFTVLINLKSHNSW